MRRNITADLSQRFIQLVRVGQGLPTILDTPRILPSTLLSLSKAVMLAVPALSVLLSVVFQGRVGSGDCSGEDTSLRLPGQSTLVYPTRGVMWFVGRGLDLDGGLDVEGTSWSG